jgi:hypothetical protein
MSRVTQHSIPRVLTQDQHDNRMRICGDLIDSADEDGMFLNHIITGDKTCFLYDPQLKQQSVTWKSPSLSRKKKPLRFFDSSGIFHMDFIPEGMTVNKHCYKEILHCLCNSICCKCPALWRRKNWLLLYNNAPAYRSVLVQEQLAKQHVTILPHPPHSPDLTPCDLFFLSPLERKATWASISVSQGDNHCHKGSHMGPSCKYLSAVFSAAIPTLADLHSGKRQLF